MAEKDTKNTQSADGGAGNVQPAPAPVDMSNTYENGVPGANINAAVPEGAHLVTDIDEALDAGYFGFARGEDATESYTLAEAGKRNARLREARQGSINQSAAVEDTKRK
jgi:hypothetical protein